MRRSGFKRGVEGERKGEREMGSADLAKTEKNCQTPQPGIQSGLKLHVLGNFGPLQEVLLIKISSARRQE